MTTLDHRSLEMATGTPPVHRTRSIWDSLSPEEFEQLQAYTKCKAFSFCFVSIYNCAVPKWRSASLYYRLNLF